MSSNPTLSAIESRVSALENLMRSQASRVSSVEAQLAAIHGGTVPSLPGAPGGTQAPSAPDQVAKSPLPTAADDAALVNGVNAFLDKTYPTQGTPTPSMYPQGAKLHDANVYVGCDLAKVTGFYQSCFNTGAYGQVQALSVSAQNNNARTRAFTTGHDAITDQLISYCSYKTAALPTKDQLV